MRMKEVVQERLLDPQRGSFEVSTRGHGFKLLILFVYYFLFKY